MKKRTLSPKLLIWILAGMMLVFGVLTARSRQTRGVYFDGALLSVTEGENAAVYSGQVRGADVEVTVRKQEAAAEVDFSSGAAEKHYVVEYPLEPVATENGDSLPGIRITEDGAVLFEGAFLPGQTGSRGWFDTEGRWSPDSSVGITPGTGKEAPTGLNRAQAAAFAMDPPLYARGSWADYGLNVFVSAIVLLAAAFPETAFGWNLFRTREQGEPPKSYRVATQAICWVLTGLALALYLLALQKIC